MLLFDLLPYLLLFALFAAPAIKQAVAPGPSSPLWVFLIGLLLTLMIGLRYQVGVDWWSYVYILRYDGMVSWSKAIVRTEPGYALLNIVAVRMHWGLWFPDLVCAAIFTIGLFKFCRQQPNPPLALAVSVPYLIIGVAMGYTRQSAALGFIFLALSLFGQGKTVGMLVSLSLAAAFHTSALMLVPVLGLATIRRGPLVPIMSLLIGGFLAYEFYQTIQLLLGRYIGGTYTSGGALPRLLMNLIPALIFIGLRRRLTASDGELRLWTIFSGLASFLAVLLLIAPSSTLIDRLGIYVTPLQVFVLSRLPTALGTRVRPSALLTAGILAYSLTVEVVWLTWGTWGHAWLPYSSYVWKPEREQVPPRWFRDVIRYPAS